MDILEDLVMKKITGKIERTTRIGIDYKGGIECPLRLTFIMEENREEGLQAGRQ